MKIGYRERPGREILEKQVKIGSKPEPEGVRVHLDTDTFHEDAPQNH